MRDLEERGRWGCGAQSPQCRRPEGERRRAPLQLWLLRPLTPFEMGRCVVCQGCPLAGVGGWGRGVGFNTSNTFSHSLEGQCEIQVSAGWMSSETCPFTFRWLSSLCPHLHPSVHICIPSPLRKAPVLRIRLPPEWTNFTLITSSKVLSAKAVTFWRVRTSTKTLGGGEEPHNSAHERWPAS